MASKIQLFNVFDEPRQKEYPLRLLSKLFNKKLLAFTTNGTVFCII